MRALIAVLGTAALAAAACDTRAQSSPASAAAAVGAVVDPERMSKEHESCGTTAHCAPGLRCFEQACQRIDRSILGDYHAALGGNAREAGDNDKALLAYDKAVKQYKADGLVVPADIDCAYGAALIDARTIEENAELAARVLHRCVNNAPAGSALRHAALRQIAILDEAGLDPLLIARPELADDYIKGAARPKSDQIGLALTVSPEPPAKAWEPVAEAIQGTKAALLACWEQGKGPVLKVAVPLEGTYVKEFDDEPGRGVVRIEEDKAPAGAAEKCVWDAVAASVKSLKSVARWKATATVTLQ